MDFSDEFLVNNHIPVFLERLIYSSVIVIGGSLFPLFFYPPRPTGTPPISSAINRGRVEFILLHCAFVAQKYKGDTGETVVSEEREWNPH